MSIVPNVIIPHVYAQHFKTYYNTDEDISLLCKITYPNEFLIDIGINVTIQWLNSSNHTLHSYTGINDYTEHTLNYTISNVKLSDAGQYTCSVFINVSVNNNAILGSDITSNFTSITIIRK